MDPTLSEKEQIDVLKKWWREYGKLLLAVIIVALVGNLGWRYYQGKQRHHAEYASVLYQQMLGNYAQKKNKEFYEHATYLSSNFKDVPYASFADFALAKDAVNQKKYTEAVDRLQRVIDGESSPRLRQVARIRQARVLLQLAKNDQALRTLSTVEEKSFLPLINEVRGDILSAKGDRAAARKAYQAAMKGLPDNGSGRSLLEMKFHELADAAPDVA